MQHVDVSERVHFLLKRANVENLFWGRNGGDWGFGWGCASIGVVFCTHPTLLNKTISCTPTSTPRKEGKGTQRTSPPFFRNHYPNPPLQKMHVHMQLALPLTLTLTLAFCLHLPSSPSFFSSLNYLTFDINITQLHLHLHLHFSLFFSLRSSPHLSLSFSFSFSFSFSLSFSFSFSFSFFLSLSLFLSLYLSLSSFVFLSKFFLWIVSLNQWIGGALDQPPLSSPLGTPNLTRKLDLKLE